MMKEELSYNEGALGVVNIGVCSDASGEARAARLLLLKEMPNMLIVDCYAHQVSCIPPTCERTFSNSPSLC